MFSGQKIKLIISNEKLYKNVNFKFLKKKTKELFENYGGLISEDSSIIFSDRFQTGKDSIQLKWIHDSIVFGSKLPFKNYQISALFQNLKFSVSSSFSMEEIEKLIAIVEYYGGEYVGVENADCTHLIWFLFFLF
jgi:hypothetical protein